MSVSKKKYQALESGDSELDLEVIPKIEKMERGPKKTCDCAKKEHSEQCSKQLHGTCCQELKIHK